MNTAEPFTLYKLIVLYILDHADIEITGSQVSDYILSKGYTDFLTLQLVLSELEETDLIKSQKMRNRTFLAVTEDGHHTISCLEDRITYAIREDIMSYLQTNHISMQEELSIRSYYYQQKDKTYEAHLIAKDKKNELVSLKINLPSKELAALTCENWDKKNIDIYRYLITSLLEEDNN